MNKSKPYIGVGSLLGLTLLSGAVLSAPKANADSSSTVDIKVNVPAACSLTPENTNLTKTINPGTSGTIGTANLKAVCNDPDGFAIYAIGYTDNVHGNNYLTTTLGEDYKIATGTATSGDTSSWNMTIANAETINNYTATIENNFDQAHIIPDVNTKIATVSSETDQTIGTNLTAQFDAYIAPTQASGTYQGKVKFTLVHPNNHPVPNETMLDTGATINKKMKSLATGTTVTTAYTENSNIKAIRMADALPNGFVASDANTISTADSKHPVYIFFDDTDGAGIMYVYSGEYQVVMNPSQSSAFRSFLSLSDITGLEDWDASQVTTMRLMFNQTTNLSSLSALAKWDTSSNESLEMTFWKSGVTSLEGLRNWDTSNVKNLDMTFASLDITSLDGLENWDTGEITSMYGTFGEDDLLVNISQLSDWDTSSVQNMEGTFAYVTNLADISALSNWNTSNVVSMLRLFEGDSSIEYFDASHWNTSNVTTMSRMFNGNKALKVLNVTGWDTSKVEDMKVMFSVGTSYLGNGQLEEIIGIEDWDTSNVTDMTGMFYGAGQMTHYNIANWDVSKVQSFNHMFCDNNKLESLDLSRWDVSSVKTMMNMFDDNYALTTIGDVSQWNTTNLVDLAGWLNGAESFVGNNGTLDLSGWNTSNLKAADEMFRAVKLTTIDLSGWTFDSITNDAWEGAGSGIYYEYGSGLDRMFLNTSQLANVYVSQSGLNSYNAAVDRGVDTTNMWSGSNISGFTLKP